MNIEHVNIEEVDRICGEFEQEWSSENSLCYLQEYLSNVSTSAGGSFGYLFGEIAQIDMEHRWRALAKTTRALSSAASEVLQQIEHQIPRWQDYSKLACSLGLNLDDKLTHMLSDCEFRVRAKYGDAPSPTTLGLADEIFFKHNKLLPTATVVHNGSPQFHTPFISPLQIGRQGKQEPPPPLLFRTDDQTKLICSALHDTSISRNQLSVQIIAGNLASVQNTSSNRSFLVDGQAVDPGASLFANFPINIDLSSITVRLRRPLLE